ncbi:MAG: hypothetical protein R3174_13275, partial [Gammaproteobacteria bacterium]|nr:hypothetical protein [Gammaproteobacteria bacterium]
MIGIVLGAVSQLAGAEGAGPSASVALKFDYDLVPRLDSPGVKPSALAADARPPEFRSRVLKVQNQARVLARTNEQKARLLA